MVCLLAAPWVQLSFSAGSGWPHNLLWHHWLMPISCHFPDCKAPLVSHESDSYKRRYSKCPDLLPLSAALVVSWLTGKTRTWRVAVKWNVKPSYSLICRFWQISTCTVRHAGWVWCVFGRCQRWQGIPDAVAALVAVILPYWLSCFLKLRIANTSSNSSSHSLALFHWVSNSSDHTRVSK